MATLWTGRAMQGLAAAVRVLLFVGGVVFTVRAGSASEVTSRVDHALEERLDREGLLPHGPADRWTLLRRVTFDLTGLPPTPEEVDAFVHDDSPGALERVVDRLLASPAYGERWARLWLDLVRYADTNGADENMAHPHAWRYRDYVIRSFNDDKPYDQFLREQLAGDLMGDETDPEMRSDRIVATGFLALGPKMLAEQDKEKLLFDVVDEQVDVLGRTVLGLTVSCARCHDHKFDPILQQDYFALAGIFRSTRTMANTDHVSRWVETVLDLPGNGFIREEHEAEVNRLRMEVARLEARAGMERGMGNGDGEGEGQKPSPEDEEALKGVRTRLQHLEQRGPVWPRAMAVMDGEGMDLAVHHRGSHLSPRGEPVPRGAVRLWQETLPPPTMSGVGSGRMDLAAWLTDPRHPMTARVWVNRMWLALWGEGLVRTPSNFGALGEEATHPELLDFLAREFIGNGWSTKRLHRSLVLTRAYQRSSRADANAGAQDPDNRLLWRHRVRRLEAEAIRDAILAVSGRLDRSGHRSLSGLESNEGYHRHQDNDFAKPSRSIYLPVVRSQSNEWMALFDGADPSMHHERRVATVVPGQALALMNDPMVLRAARDLAAMAKGDAEVESLERAVERLQVRVYGRLPRAGEMELWQELLTSSDAEEAWERLCRIMLASNEFIHIH